jgi:hypothetical protein
MKNPESQKKADAPPAPAPSKPSPGDRNLKSMGGSNVMEWNASIANQVRQATWTHADEDRSRHDLAVVGALVGLKPQDEIEGMLCAQLLACHNLAMESYRRALHPDQTLPGREQDLNAANKLSRTYAALVESLNKHRGKGQQKIVVERVDVHSGGQAIVGSVEAPLEGGGRAKNEEQPHAKESHAREQQQITHAPQPPMSRADAVREALQVARDAERRLSNARR